MLYITIVSAVATLIALVIHKRTMYRRKSGRGGIRAFFAPCFLYFFPTAIVWGWVVHRVSQLVPLPAPWWPITAMIGVYLLANLLLKDEIEALRRP
jgi:hypothetical protein